MRTWAAPLSLILLIGSSASVSAQAARTSPGRLETSFGAGVQSGIDFGDQPADLRAGGSGDPYRLFASDSRLARSGGIEARVGFALTRRFVVEGRAGLARPEWRTSVSSDFERAADATLVERINHYTFDGGVRVQLNEWRFKGVVPFAAAGAGYLRQLHEGDTLVEERAVYYVGGGVTRTLFDRARGLLNAGGVRADVRLNVLGGGGSFGETAHRHAALTGGVFVVF